MLKTGLTKVTFWATAGHRRFDILAICCFIRMAVVTNVCSEKNWLDLTWLNLTQLDSTQLDFGVDDILCVWPNYNHCVIGWSFSTSSEDLYCNKIGSEAFLIFYTLNEQSFSKIICRPLLLRIIMTPLTTATIYICYYYLYYIQWSKISTKCAKIL